MWIDQYEDKNMRNHCYALCKKTVPFIINAFVGRQKETLFPHTQTKQWDHYESSKWCERKKKFCWNRNRSSVSAASIRCLTDCSLVLLGQHKVLKVQWLCSQPILCSSEVAAASLFTNDSSTLAFTEPWENFLHGFWRISTFKNRCIFVTKQTSISIRTVNLSHFKWTKKIVLSRNWLNSSISQLQ